MASHGVRGLRGLLAGSEIICRQLLALEHDDDLEFFGAKFLVDPILYFPKTRLRNADINLHVSRIAFVQSDPSNVSGSWVGVNFCTVVSFSFGPMLWLGLI